MSITSLKSLLSAALKDDYLKTQCHLMKVTYLILLSFHHITFDSAECACVLASRLCNEFFNEHFEVNTNQLCVSNIRHG